MLAPIVKWISRLASDQSLGVRIPLGAHENYLLLSQRKNPAS